MKKNFIYSPSASFLLFSLFFAHNISLFAQEINTNIPDAKAFFGYEFGENFTFYHKVVDYINTIDQLSTRVKAWEYGKTYENRPLMVCAISSPENLASLDEIRLNNLKRTGMIQGEIKGKNMPIIWLSYNIHGNEASGTEAGLRTLYELATKNDENTKKWLDNLVIMLDICENPDGRDRYVNNYYQRKGKNPNPYLQTWEHQEPFPSGRFNHYFFDLNRDWAWQTQVESQKRVALQQQYLPQIHADFHEMGLESSYFFAPASRPFHENITFWQREFQQIMGENHSKYFNQNRWLFFTQEVYDLLYPSYGDTYPSFQGAIGFTYEQGGSGRAGLATIRQQGDTLTLHDRYFHHFTVSISTIEVAYNNREKLLKEFEKFYKDSRENPVATYKTYIIKHNQNPQKIKALLQLLDKQQIQYGHPITPLKTKGYAYHLAKNTDTKTESKVDVEEKDIVLSMYQPKSTLLKVLFEPQTYLEDSITYDLTAWALPFAYNLKAYALKEKIAINTQKIINANEWGNDKNINENVSQKNDFGYLCDWEDVKNAVFLGELLQQNIKIRFTNEDFTLDKKVYKRGSFLILHTDNKHLKDMGEILSNISKKHQINVQSINNGKVENGKDLGSDELNLLTAPQVALVLGDDVSPTEFGAIWHFFDQELNYPAHILHADRLGKSNLFAYKVVILSAGNFQNQMPILMDFVTQGGRIIAIDDAIESFAKDNRTTLHKTIEQQNSLKKDKLPERQTVENPPYNKISRFEISQNTAGSIFRLAFDDTHPLSFGIGNQLDIIKQNRTIYPRLPETIAYYDTHIAGFVGQKLKNKIGQSLAIGTEKIGKGQIVYFVDAPIFRGFWHAGKLLFANAVFMSW